MNLFILSTDPAKAAEAMMDKHIHKILLEAVQMLSTAVRVLEPELSESVANSIYKLAHKNHPVTIWCRTSRANFIWTLDHIDALHAEWKYRYAHPESKIHKSYMVAQILRANIPADNLFPVSSIESSDTTPFALAMPVQYKDPSGDAVASYRAYYMSPEKTRIAKWAKRRSAPYWWVAHSATVAATVASAATTAATTTI
jgi:Pyrimidine dimer DNA glycosylase